MDLQLKMKMFLENPLIFSHLKCQEEVRAQSLPSDEEQEISFSVNLVLARNWPPSDTRSAGCIRQQNYNQRNNS